MIKWEYRVIPVEELFPDQVDHDIAVLKQAAATRRSKMGKGLEENLNQLGADGWELINILGEIGIFKKLKE